MNDRELLESIAAQVGSLTQEVGGLKKGLINLEKKVDAVDSKVDAIDKKVDVLDKRVDAIDRTVIRMENDNNIHHTALFDGWKQNTQQLERIENEVSKQDEIIMRRIK